jgi:carboxymethylenebutenolidase
VRAQDSVLKRAKAHLKKDDCLAAGLFTFWAEVSMRHRALFLTVAALWASFACGQDWAKAKLEKSSRHGEYVQLKHGDRTLQAWVVYPEVSKKATSVVVIHEIFGLTDWARLAADELAEAGYIAIAPDLVGAHPDENVMQAIRKLPPEQVLADLDAAADYIKAQPAANGKVAVAGFCWGGGKSFDFATHRKDLAASFVFYGIHPPEKAMSDIACPVYGFYAENDARITATVPATEKMMKEASKQYDVVIYPGAGHGFMRAGEDPKANEANSNARDASWKRLKNVLGKL